MSIGAACLDGWIATGDGRLPAVALRVSIARRRRTGCFAPMTDGRDVDLAMTETEELLVVRNKISTRLNNCLSVCA